MTQTPEQLNKLAIAIAAALQATGAGEASEPTVELTPKQQKEQEKHLLRVAEAKEAREKAFHSAAVNVSKNMIHGLIHPRITCLFLRGGAQSLAWTHHRNRGYIDYLTRRISEAKTAGVGGTDNSIGTWEEMIASNYAQNDSIEVLALASEMEFDRNALLVERETGTPFTLTFVFDISERAFAEFQDKDAAARVARNKSNAAVTGQGNELVHLATIPSAILSMGKGTPASAK